MVLPIDAPISGSRLGTKIEERQNDQWNQFKPMKTWHNIRSISYCKVRVFPISLAVCVHLYSAIILHQWYTG